MLADIFPSTYTSEFFALKSVSISFVMGITGYVWGFYRLIDGKKVVI